jgi:hypothetical protein
MYRYRYFIIPLSALLVAGLFAITAAAEPEPSSLSVFAPASPVTSTADVPPVPATEPVIIPAPAVPAEEPPAPATAPVEEAPAVSEEVPEAPADQPMRAPTVILTADAAGRELARTLPASNLPVDVFTNPGVTFDRGYVVAWYGDDSGQHFLMERADGSRTVVIGNGMPGGPFRHPLEACETGAQEDAFGPC